MSGEKNKTGNVPNRLINEKSPYLLQHAENPVDWYPWCNEAFEKARTENKPVFLSIGYSTCHWCHVMARESFEDADVAGLLNDVFVCVKVDREERPDIDKVYMSACQMMTGSGGWPLTIVMTPDKQPFFAATYIPKESRFNRFGLMDIIPKIREVWIKQRDDVAKSAGQIVASLQRKGPELKGEAVSEKILDAAYNELAALYDEKHGGFGRAPKFPMPHQIIFLLRYWKWRGKNEALDMAAHTLRAMRYGGMYDHIGFGFHRYSTDEKWLVPHFEKMLYDQAMLAMAYTEAYQATGEDFFKRTACEIFTYVMRDMKSPSGGFYSAEDADTEGEEGKYYLWTDDEIEELMGPSDAELVTGVFRVEKGGNFVDPFAGGKTGHNILHMGKPASEIAHSLGISEESLHKRLSAARTKLFDAREGRTRPHKDDKILADWNGLMIAALAQGARVYANTAYLKAAQKAAKFVLKNMKDRNGRMFHRHRQGDSAITANLDDYAFLIWGLIECYEASFDASFLESALRLQENLMKHYWDKENGGFYFTPDDGEELILRQKEIYDGAIPSGNSVAMLNLVRLARITGKHEFEAQAAAVSAHFGNIIRNAPSNHGQFMIAVGFLTQPAHEIVIAGMPKAKDTKEMVQAIRRHYIPNTVVLLRPPDEASPEIVGIAPFTKDLISLDNRATAYVCSNFTCQRPTTDVVEMIGLLNIQEKAEWKK